MKRQKTRGRKRLFMTLAVTGLGVAALLSLVMQSSSAVFTDSSANPKNLFTAGTLLLKNSEEGAFVVDAAGLLPGTSASGSLAIEIEGDGPAQVVLTGKSDGSELARALTLLIEETTGTAKTLWKGTMAELDELPLGVFLPGSGRSYRFTITFPAEQASPALLPSSANMTLRFIGVAK